MTFADIPLAELRTLAWRTFDCGYCDEHAGRRCITASGERTTPHLHRLTQARTWVARQPEVDELTGRLLDLGATVEQTEQALARMTTERDDLRVNVRALTTEVSGLTEANGRLSLDNAAAKTAIAARDVTIAGLRARIAELEKAPTPTPAQRTRFGACPEKPGGATLSAQQRVVDKWGKGAAARVFLGTEAVPRHADLSILHASWKPTLEQITPAWVTSITKNLREGDVVEVWHESDKKVSDGKYTYDQALAYKNAFYDLVKHLRPDLLVANTVTGWLTDPKSGKDVDRWGAVKADVFGIDCDGVRPTALPYTDYTAETTRALAFIEKFKANGYRYFAVPEFGCPRIPEADPDGTKRAAYHDKYASLWRDSGKCLFVTLYEYDSSPNYSLTTAAEINGWKQHV